MCVRACVRAGEKKQLITNQTKLFLFRFSYIENTTITKMYLSCKMPYYGYIVIKAQIGTAERKKCSFNRNVAKMFIYYFSLHTKHMECRTKI